MVSLAQLQEVPYKNMILLVGLPGSGKSTFCQQTILRNIEVMPVIYVTTESAPSKVEDSLREKGLGRAVPHTLSFVDAFHETVGLSTADRPNTVKASSEDLTSLGIAISKLRESMSENVLVVFDSLTSPYLMNGPETLRFIRMSLLRLAAEGNSVIACMDEGCGKEEDLGAMMSLADGIIKMDITENSKIITVIKHPKVAPTKIETPLTWSTMVTFEKVDLNLYRRIYEAIFTGRGGPFRTEIGDYVNVFWRNLAFWSGMLWDPKRFPTMAYELAKEVEFTVDAWAMKNLLPWRSRLLFRFLMPKDFSEVRSWKKFMSSSSFGDEKDRGMQISEYLEDQSKKNEHYVRMYESHNCWGLDNVGARLSFQFCGMMAGMFKAFESLKGFERDWNVVETKCIGLGHPYCELKFVPGEIDEMKGFLEGIDSSIVEKINGRIMDQLVGFLVHGDPLGERPRLGSNLSYFLITGEITYPGLLSERYRVALRMGGAKAGKEAGSHLMNAGMEEDQAIRRLVDLLQYCNIGKITLGDTLRIKENCESFGLETKEPSCFFLTAFLNGFFSAVKNQHVKETKCIAIGDPYCEWEFR
jgi:predicted hydrocarbon binding protein/KaiC/GvpD/RAD55 family RecA-like ATPase